MADMVSELGVGMPKAPPGFSACRVYDTTSRTQTSHLVRRVGRGTPGPTLCGLTRFDDRDPTTREIIRKADLPGWGMDGGLSGLGITQSLCDACWKQGLRDA
jgi:hypothetical protein